MYRWAGRHGCSSGLRESDLWGLPQMQLSLLLLGDQRPLDVNAFEDVNAFWHIAGL